MGKKRTEKTLILDDTAEIKDTLGPTPEQIRNMNLENEKAGISYIIQDLKQLVETIEARYKLIRFLHDDESREATRSDPKFEALSDADFNHIFSGVYALDRATIVPLVEDFKVAEEKLQNILRLLK